MIQRPKVFEYVQSEPAPVMVDSVHIFLSCHWTSARKMCSFRPLLETVDFIHFRLCICWTPTISCSRCGSSFLSFLATPRCNGMISVTPRRISVKFILTIMPNVQELFTGFCWASALAWLVVTSDASRYWHYIRR